MLILGFHQKISFVGKKNFQGCKKRKTLQFLNYNLNIKASVLPTLKLSEIVFLFNPKRPKRNNITVPWNPNFGFGVFLGFYWKFLRKFLKYFQKSSCTLRVLILVLSVILLDNYIVYAIPVQFSPDYIVKGTFFLLLKKQNLMSFCEAYILLFVNDELFVLYLMICT